MRRTQPVLAMLTDRWLRLPPSQTQGKSGQEGAIHVFVVVNRRRDDLQPCVSFRSTAK